MPYKTCLNPMCKEIMPLSHNGSYCKTHKSLSRGASKSDNYRFYQSTAWKRLRDSYKRLHPLCEKCSSNGIFTPADIVDHVIEIKDDPSLKFSWDNLMCLCHRCHNIKTAQERRKRKERTPSAGDVFRQ